MRILVHLKPFALFNHLNNHSKFVIPAPEPGSILKNVLLATLFLFSPLAATSLKLEITDNGQGQASPTVTAGVPFEVTISVVDGNRDTGTVDLGGTDQVKVVGSSRSTNITMLNGRFSSQTAYVYQLYALTEGDLKLGPAHVKQGGQTIESNVLELKVAKAAEQAPAPAPKGTAAHEIDADHAPTHDTQAAVLCRLTADKKTAVIGEPITAKITVLSRGQVLQVALEPPKFPGFTVKEIQNVGRRQEAVNNTPYSVVEKKYVLIPTEQGTKTIEPIRVAFAVPVKQRPRHHGLFDDAFLAGFFDQDRVVQKTAASNALSLTINALPENQGQLEGVGEFTSFTAHVNKKDAHVNEALTLKLELAGQGNLEQIVAPKLILPAFMKAYDSKSTVHEDLTADYHGGKKTFEYVVQIAQEGDAEIPPQQFTYFDTASKTVKTFKTPSIMVHLTPAPQALQPKISPQTQAVEPEDEQPPTPKKSNAQAKQDISFIQEDGPVMQHPGTGANLLLLLLFLLLIPGMIFGKQSINRTTTKLFPKFFKDHGYKKHLDHLHREFGVLHHNKQVDKLYQFFVKFLAIKSNVAVETITHDWLQEYLTNQRWEEAKITAFFDFLNECARCHFVSNTAHGKTDPEELFKKGSYWLLLLK